jgi:signal transduction histidine kinase
MTATLAHEINQPLAAIVTNSDAALRWLARDPPNLDEGRNAIDRIRRDSSRANDLIKRMRVVTQKHAPSFAPLDLNQALEEVLVYVRPDQRRLDFLIQTDLSAGLPPVQGDWVQLQQVILNLVLNGIEAMRGVTGRPRVLRITSRLTAAGAVLVAVEDNGVGLDPATADRIFDSLFTTREGGTGLGLSVSRSIVEAHGGRLWVENATPHGAIFRFTIPAAPGDAP